MRSADRGPPVSLSCESQVPEIPEIQAANLVRYTGTAEAVPVLIGDLLCRSVTRKRTRWPVKESGYGNYESRLHCPDLSLQIPVPSDLHFGSRQVFYSIHGQNPCREL